MQIEIFQKCWKIREISKKLKNLKNLKKCTKFTKFKKILKFKFKKLQKLQNLQNLGKYFPRKVNVYRCDRAIDNVNFIRRSGGVAMLVPSKFKSRLMNLNNDFCEYLAIEIKINPPIVIYAAYMRVFHPVVAHVKSIKEMISRFPNHRIVVVDDFNLHGVIWNPSDIGAFSILSNIPTNATEFIAEMQDLALFQLSNIVNASSNVLDLFFFKWAKLHQHQWGSIWYRWCSTTRHFSQAIRNLNRLSQKKCNSYCWIGDFLL